MREGRRDRDGGFTLVETLIALAVAGLFAMMLYEGFRLGGRVWSSLSARAAAIDEIGVAHRLLRQVLDQAYPLPAPAAQGYRIDFRGERAGLSFWTPPPDIWSYPGGIIQARLRMVADGGRKRLELALSENLANPQKTETIVLLTDVADVTLEYFGIAEGAAGTWSSGWIDRPALPQLIRLRVNFRDGDRRHWPELIVAPKTELDTECVIDLLTQQCRGR